MSDPPYRRRIEALLFAAAEPLSAADLAAYAGPGDVAAALAELAAECTRRGVHLVERGGRWHLQTAPDLAPMLSRLTEVPRPLGRAAAETLAIIAYRQPATRAEVEAVRGVAVAGGTLDTLLDAGWVRLAGRRESPGRPLQYATTPAFLAAFGLASLKDLPSLAELRGAGLLDAAPPPATFGL